MRSLHYCVLPVSTADHARLFAHRLTQADPSDGVERLSRLLPNAPVERNPHQSDGAIRPPASESALDSALAAKHSHPLQPLNA
jgi:hypothetical protein